MAQLRDFVGKLGGLQTEHQALRLRASISWLLRTILDLAPDTGLSELIVPLTRTDIFNKSLEIQQSKRIFESCSNPFILLFIYLFLDLLASYEITAQLNAIEDLIAQGAEMQIVLRLLCLASLTAGGVKAKTLENIKREILQVCHVHFSRECQIY